MESSEKTTKKISTKNRNIGLDFLRVLCMIMVVLLHYLEKGGLLQEENSKGIDYTIYNILKSAAIIAVNCYVLISGYFLIKSQFKVKKILRLWGEVIFYSYTIYILLFSFGLIEFKFMELVKSIFPIISKQYWFI